MYIAHTWYLRSCPFLRAPEELEACNLCFLKLISKSGWMTVVEKSTQIPIHSIRVANENEKCLYLTLDRFPFIQNIWL